MRVTLNKLITRRELGGISPMLHYASGVLIKNSISAKNLVDLQNPSLLSNLFPHTALPPTISKVSFDANSSHRRRPTTLRSYHYSLLSSSHHLYFMNLFLFSLIKICAPVLHWIMMIWDKNVCISWIEVSFGLI